MIEVIATEDKSSELLCEVMSMQLCVAPGEEADSTVVHPMHYPGCCEGPFFLAFFCQMKGE